MWNLGRKHTVSSTLAMLQALLSCHAGAAGEARVCTQHGQNKMLERAQVGSSRPRLEESSISPGVSPSPGYPALLTKMFMESNVPSTQRCDTEK